MAKGPPSEPPDGVDMPEQQAEVHRVIEATTEAGQKVMILQTQEPAPDRAAQRLTLVRGYVLIGVGVLMIIYAFVPPQHPAVLTLGIGVLGLNPLMRAGASLA